MILVKSLLGALLVVLISSLSNSRYYLLAGLVPLFPTFALVAHYTVGSQRTNAELKATILYSMLGLIPYCIYLISAYLLIDRMGIKMALFCSTLCWTVSALLIVVVQDL